MKSFRVLSASVNPDSGFVEVVKEITADDNTTSLNLHAFHPECLEWKAVEFGLNDPDEIIDGILHEPFFDADIQPLQSNVATAQSNFRTHLAAAKAKFTNATPRNGSLIKAQLRAAGVDQRHIDAADSDPFQAIKSACPMHAEVIAVKQEHTDYIRKFAVKERVRQANLKQQAPPTPAQRAERLRESRRTLPIADDRPPHTPVEEVSLPPVTLGERRGGPKTG